VPARAWAVTGFLGAVEAGVAVWCVRALRKAVPDGKLTVSFGRRQKTFRWGSCRDEDR